MTLLKHIFSILLISCCILTGCKNPKESDSKVSEEITTTYYLIRHAEKDRSDTSNKDPMLTEEGHARGKRWAAYFKDKNLDYIYTTPYQRTTQTATHVAMAIDSNFVLYEYNPRNLYDSTFQEETQGKTSLVVGHSNTTPDFVNAIIGMETYEDIPDDDNGRVYKVVVKNSDHKVTMENVE